MSRKLLGTHYQATSCDVVIYLGIVNVLVVSDSRWREIRIGYNSQS